MQQRVLEVLLAIIRRRGELIGKEQLIDEVWRGEVVGDASLARCLYEARRALGDDARRPKYLLTVHGRGYRLADGVCVEVAEGIEAIPAMAAVEPAESGSSSLFSSPLRLRWRAIAAAAAVVVLGVALIWLVGARRRTAVHPASSVVPRPAPCFPHSASDPAGAPHRPSSRPVVEDGKTHAADTRRRSGSTGR